MLPAMLVVACGGGGGGGSDAPSGPAAFRTVAYVYNECRDDPDGRTFAIRQEVRVLRDDGTESGALVTVDAFAAEGLPAHPLPGPIEPHCVGAVRDLSVCAFYGVARDGSNGVMVGVYQRLAVTPDGSAVVFEKTDDFSAYGADRFLPPEEEGIFHVRADGTGRRRLGAASREASFRAGKATTNAAMCDVSSQDTFGISPDGRHVSFTDLGPDPSGNHALQVVAVDLDTGARRALTQLEHLDPAPDFPLQPSVVSFGFIDDDTVLYRTRTVAGATPYLVSLDASPPQKIELGALSPSGGDLGDGFHISGGRAGTQTFTFSIAPEVAEYPPNTDLVREVLWFDAESSYLELTNFRRGDTRAGALSVDGEHVFLNASTNRLGTNPEKSCQLFSIDVTGAELLQLTHGPETAEGCNLEPPSCDFQILGQDVVTKSVLFVSTCDLANRRTPFGEGVFAIRPDGSGLRLLTPLRGGEIGVPSAAELAGPVAFSRTGAIGRTGR
ncbi:MAG: hypothetical protein AB1689_19725 [Thermodesulfobacteriota bacterium]